MTAEQWTRVESLLAEAERLAPDRRGPFLEESCRDDPAIQTEVLALLGELENETPFLSRPLIAPTPQAGGSWEPDHRIGAYRLIRALGQGGMGTVYLARRDDGVHEGYVALKIIRSGLSAEQTVQQAFDRERRLLASLSHPYIARLLDGGSTAEGEPYLVMEFVDGEPLTAYCERHGLNLEQRLRLFGRICEAVSYAHRNLVLHRDLKPSNIFICGDGSPRLLDFGVARLMDDPGATEGAAGTAQSAFTPDYAAPEVRAAEMVSTAADVYSLGVILHEVLTGTRPAPAAGDGTASISAVSPSTVVEEVAIGRRTGTEAAKVQAVAEAMGRTPAALRNRLRGDIDAILLRALYPEPERRYPSAELLATDIDRHLRSLPLTARAHEPGYRARRFIRRNRWGVGSAAVLASLVLSFAGITMAQNERIRAHAEEVSRERDRAEETTRFLVDLFGEANPARARGEVLSAGDLLFRGAERLETDLARQATTRGALHMALAEAFEAFGQFEAAAREAEAALAVFDGAGEGEAARLATATSLLGWVLHRQGRSEEGRLYLERAVTMRRDLLGPRHPMLARSMNDLGVVEQALGDLVTASTSLREAYDIRLAAFGPNHESVGVTSNNLAALYWQRGMLDSALVWQNKTVQTLAAVRDPRDPQLAIAVNNLATLHMTRGNYRQADSLYGRVLWTRLAVLGRDHPDLAQTYSTLAALRISEGNLASADTLVREGLRIRFAALGANHPDVAISRLQLANVSVEAGELEVATREALLAREIFLRAYGAEHHWTANAIYRLGEIAHHEGRLEHARTLYEQAAAITASTLGPDHNNLARMHQRMGELDLVTGNAKGALVHYRRALELTTARLSARHPDAASAHLGIAAALEAANDSPDDVVAHRRHARDIREEVFGAQHAFTVEAASLIARRP